MGLDLVLGVFVLIWAVRGWFKGFALQAIGLAALVGCVYLADPVRDAIRPYAREYLPSIQADVLDRLLWWASAVSSYVLTAGTAGWIVKMRRRKPYIEIEPNRADQGAGFVLGGLKGAVAASFLAAAMVQYAPNYVKPGGVVEEQTKASQALAWSVQYRPAERIWNSPPVQSFVRHVHSRGFWGESGPDQDKKEAPDAVAEGDPRSTPKAPPAARLESNGPKPPPVASPKPVGAVRRAPPLTIPRRRTLVPGSPNFLEDVDKELSELGLRPSKSR